MTRCCTMDSLGKNSSCSSCHRALRECTVTVTVLVLGILLWTSPLSAQSLFSQRVAVEFASAITTSSPTPDDPFVVLDATATVRMTDTLDVIVRPWIRRLPGGDWSKEMYQLQVRYQPATRVPLRIDAGIISSPLGIIALEMRPDRNPFIGIAVVLFLAAALVRRQVRSRAAPVGRLSLGRDGEPLGTEVGCARRGHRRHAGAEPEDDVVESPAGRAAARRRRRRHADPRPPSRRRLRARHLSRPDYDGLDLARAADRAASATVFNLEGEYAVGYTRIAGEWILDSFETATTPAVARGYLLEAVRTLTPRWYSPAARRVPRRPSSPPAHAYAAPTAPPTHHRLSAVARNPDQGRLPGRARLHPHRLGPRRRGLAGVRSAVLGGLTRDRGSGSGLWALGSGPGHIVNRNRTLLTPRP